MYRPVICAFALAVLIALAGIAQGQQIDWNARAPWGPQDHSEPVELQKKDPYKMFDNVWQVGIQTATVWLITSPAGHFLFDATGVETAPLVLENIRKAGFNPRDIKYLIITHAHMDHFGGAEQIRQATGGALIGMSQEDWEAAEQLWREAAAKSSKPGQKPGAAPPMPRYLVIADGQTLTLGDNTLKFYVTPGHTPGSTSTEFRARDGTRTYRVLIPGGLGFPNAQWTPAYLKSTEQLKALGPWDVMLPNHGDMMTPRRLRDLEPAIKARQPGQPHPAVQGSAHLNEWFDAIIKVTNEKIAQEQGRVALKNYKVTRLKSQGSSHKVQFTIGAERVQRAVRPRRECLWSLIRIRARVSSSKSDNRAGQCLACTVHRIVLLALEHDQR